MSEHESWKEEACARVDRERQSLVELSRRMHEHPELRFEEHRAAAWLSDYLAAVGFDVERGAYGLPTAFAARVGQGRPRVAILCEYDALPGIGHACGHNIIGAAGAGAGAALVDLVAETGGSVVVLGTPGEEGGGGKILMARAGAFEDVEAALMIHPAGMELACMNVLAVSQIDVEYIGRAAHASAFPHRGINALDALVTAYVSIAQLRQHIRSSERIHGIITDGGQAPNIVPERAAGVFLVRAASEHRLAKLRQRVEACFRAGAIATGAELTLRSPGLDYSDMISSRPLLDAYIANAERLGRRVLELSEVVQGVAGSTDMGNVSKLVPAIHPMIEVSPPNVPLHSIEFARWASSEAGQRAVVDGAKMLAMTAIDALARPDLLETARRDLAAQRSTAESGRR